ncbi:uncharacterized protein BDV14DRAFT_178263 [Aspergillus stella-maris]|uniref:uncharacterized protein n=1 Tax=Aspergillus stella-maris TaxID=1810926 RepID=UPI003CCCDCF3
MAEKGAQGAGRNYFSELTKRLSKTRVVSWHLSDIYRKTKASPDIFLTDSDLMSSKIEMSPLNLETEDQGAKQTLFYHPTAESELPTIDWNILDLWEARPNYSDQVLRIQHNLHEVCIAVAWAYHYDPEKRQPWVDCKKNNTNPTFETSFCAPYKWEAYHAAQAKVAGSSVPHLRSDIVNYVDLDPQESLARGEVMAIAAYMEWRSKQRAHWEHYYFPILFISMFRSGARILQAHHNGKSLVISKSKFYDLSGDDNDETYKLFARWIFSNPCGNTTTPLPIPGDPLPDVLVRKLERTLAPSRTVTVA